MTEHRARKRFGQNFLTDHGIIHRIARAIKAGPKDHLVEIGPGQGALTDELLAAGAPLDAIELDRDLVPILQQRFADEAHFTLHQGDALAFDFASLQKADEQLRIVGNLPYNISTPLIFHLLAHQHLIKDMHFMLQLEVVQRMAAQPRGKNYGRLGVMCQYYCKVEMLFEVPPESFDPRPKVQSAIVRLTPHQELPHVAKDIKKLDTILRTAFNMRRKTLRNSLKQLFSEADIEALGIDPTARPETLSLEDFIRLSNALS
ncbi:16S rRNA (adenine(1518)-N(6)/adenine(1519)-N(6))-dimethyltransferase RsmA [Dasania sp. GY-MA-18]|uniref:Ribosomal RNA small subunit methyltransferase A n=1 Tax=Dasania phycosphaerae TaxID=2950436 RepID=A0A9J6RKJ1_9GAMM|nr:MULTISPECIES: 16S rRNA (adenine(1518)-N(6)/adenine(1519)-N(6))-dimethyltransferase RsmA [Dasania]MCR8922316.1 16S rRNA (adenine(1518)-N(6)/adenine(1519)-N(6))-dimethyltransferase RsmA [Dasania sp. GY-MA-18]MCZ0864744.1 16S rRNA (adenine(1518)-N(6)/adenine(1519)-N(6))-dimethyltransferase RsmA [Dasania phycosphaerae]MCZ0868472.1 16S rRNA (adenine(1518)-N(6)/adenine(1519)-N(6))-dimethyltransferase RsmA [Dasania phycosphaerae]